MSSDILPLLQEHWDGLRINAGCDSPEELIRACADESVRIEECESARVMPQSGLLMLYDDHPRIIYVRGGRLPDDAMTCAMVGCRKASGRGVRIAEECAAALAELGFTVVSGLAKGIDAAAHTGALKAGGHTVAVVPTGLGNQVISPRQSTELARAILLKDGLLVSEYGPHREIGRDYSVFFERNRLIIGLSEFCVAIEAAVSNGTRHACLEALKQYKNVYVYKPKRRTAGFNYDETGALYQDVLHKGGREQVRTFSSPDELAAMVSKRQLATLTK